MAAYAIAFNPKTNIYKQKYASNFVWGIFISSRGLLEASANEGL